MWVAPERRGTSQKLDHWSGLTSRSVGMARSRTFRAYRQKRTDPYGGWGWPPEQTTRAFLARTTVARPMCALATSNPHRTRAEVSTEVCNDPVASCDRRSSRVLGRLSVPAHAQAPSPAAGRRRRTGAPFSCPTGKPRTDARSSEADLTIQETPDRLIVDRRMSIRANGS